MASDATPDTEYEGNALRIFGPPGTGKTTYLAKRVRATVAEHGPESLLLASFSVTAAHEIGSRFSGEGAAPNPKMIGTLHSHAYRANGPTSVALDPRVLADWNETVSPELHITPDTRKSGGTSGIDSGALSADPETARTGDELLAVLDRFRASMTPPAEWPDNVRSFAERWSAWKADVGAVDFSDMIETAYLRARDGEKAPGNPSYLVVDEAQDMTPLESALALEWGKSAGTLVLGMDDDQAINQWRGGDPEPLLALHGDGVRDHVLDRSFRVPESVRLVAERWVRRLSLRREKVYQSRLDGDGQVVHGIAGRVAQTLNDPGLVERIAADVDAGHSVMVIAACNYMLEPLIANLRRVGMPFHNPYRPAEQRWNPLGAPTREGAMSTAERISRFLSLEQGDWTGGDLQAWSELIKLSDAHMVRGAKAAIKQMGSSEPISFERVAALFSDTPEGQESLVKAVEPDVSFLEGALLKVRRDAAAYPIQVARQRGASALKEAPQVVVGTVHCSPPDEPVLTTDGYVPIGELDPDRHRLASYQARANYPTWNARQDKARTRRGYTFTRACNPYSGDMLTVTTEVSRTRITPDHRVRVRFADDFMDKWAVYLMRRGDWWRVGICVTAYRPYRSGGVGGRLSTEQADDGWILRVCDTRREALIAEAQIQAQYGIPGLTFEAAKGRAWESADLHSVHSSVAGLVAPRAKELLEDHGLSVTCPLYTRRPGTKRVARDLRGGFVTEARNLLSGYMEMPTIRENFAIHEKPTWHVATVEREHYEGDIYSLEVLPHHYYISGGAIVHNSVKGATSDVVYVSPDVSSAARRTMSDRRGVDEVIRLFYVAMTRSFVELRLLTPATRTHLRTDELLPTDLEVTG